MTSLPLGQNEKNEVMPTNLSLTAGAFLSTLTLSYWNITTAGSLYGLLGLDPTILTTRPPAQSGYFYLD